MAEEGATVPEWMSEMDPDMAANLVAKEILTPGDLAKSYNELGAKVREKVSPPGENPTTEQMRKFREKAGLIDPEKPGYTLPEDLPEAGRELVDALTQTLPEGSFTDAEYRDWAHKLASREASTRQEAITQAREATSKWADQSREEHGSDAIESTEQFLTEYFEDDPEMQKWIMTRAKKPKMVEMITTLQEAMKERPMPQHEPNLRAPAEKMTIQQMGHELSQLQDITNASDFKSADPANAELVAKQERLFQIMYKGGFKSAQSMMKHRG